MIPKCHQCPNPAFYSVGRNEAEMKNLCLSCWSILKQMNFMDFLQNASMYNNALDQMDTLVPIGVGRGRIPVAEIARAMSRSATYNNISIQNSNIGVVNTGNLARIDAAITISQSQGAEIAEFGARLKDLTETIVGNSEISEEIKRDLIDIVQTISDQAIASKTPSKVVVDTLFDRLKSMATDVTVVAAAAEKLYQAWEIVKTIL